MERNGHGGGQPRKDKKEHYVMLPRDIPRKAAKGKRKGAMSLVFPRKAAKTDAKA